ncbi:unnamed protein product [Phytomonas sp. EM1]|nr:unnamed protein product [Phytomonas sp. EM1]|eukprot:CCW63639.1 unnamed protein product [Phytomonas sp. isolate EM1]
MPSKNFETRHYERHTDHYSLYEDRDPFYTYGPFRIVTIFMAVVFLVALFIGVVLLLFYASDFVEDHPTYSKMVLQRLIVGIAVVHLLIMIIDQLSWWRSILSLLINVLYWNLVRRFPPAPSENGTIFIVALVSVVVESVAWWFLLVQFEYNSLFVVGSFFILLWIVPLGLLMSCSMEESYLPAVGGNHRSVHGNLDGVSRGHGDSVRRKTIFNSIAELFKRQHI